MLLRWRGVTPSQVGYPLISWMRYPPPHPDLGRGYPISWMGYPPGPDLGRGVGYPLSAGWATPSPLSWMGYPPSRPGKVVLPVNWMGYPHPDLGMGTPHQLDGVPPCPDLGRGYPPSVDGVPLPAKCEWTDACENITFPILRMRAVKFYWYLRTGSSAFPQEMISPDCSGYVNLLRLQLS